MPRPHFTKAPPVPHKSDHNSKQTNLQSKACAAVQRERKAHLSIAMLCLQSSHQFKNSCTSPDSQPSWPFDTLTMLAPPLLCPDQ
ncbi:hypothetical protein M0R45_009246 [Rubus argutus]|uniref:Uncharacterized protein n=1 Tax=Rubus argutus TaxID=59490 RepID=A0AAW1Y5A5_RUBAR